MTIWMKNKAAPHQTDSIDIGRLPSVIHPCNYHHDEDDHDHDEDDHDHDEDDHEDDHDGDPDHDHDLLEYLFKRHREYNG